MKALKLIILAVASLALLGCFESLILIRVNKDGSGTIEETVVLSDSFVELMKGFGGQEAAGEGSGEEEEEAVDQEKLEAKAGSMGAGVRLVSAEALRTERGSGYRAVYSFTDINQVQVNQNPGENVSAPSMGGEQEEPLKEWLRFKFTRGAVATLEIINPQEQEFDDDEEGEQEEAAELESDPGMMEMMRQLYQDMHIGIAVQVNGSITQTNASYVEGSKVTLMDVDFGKLLQDEEKFRELLSANPQSMEEMKEVLQDNEGIRIETGQSIRIQFK